MDRRAFLSIVAGSPFVFGLGELLAQDTPPDFLAAALKRMKETRRFGVLLVIPTGKESQKRLGEGLLARLPTGSKAGGEGFELFCAHVFACVGEAEAAPFGGGKPAGEGILRILLGPDGKWIASDRVGLDIIESAAKFRQSFATFIHGTDGARLRDHARAIEKDMSEDLKKAAGRLGGEPTEARAAINLLKAGADSIAPWLVQKALESEGVPFRAVLWEYYLEQSVKLPEPSLPYGIRVERVAVEDPCPPCGMAAYRPTAYRFLSFYAK